MLGNDVVDLADPEAREVALHPRFDARVFAAGERILLERAAERGTLRWALWAAKEAAYKAARQLDPALRFHPRAFVVEGSRVLHAERCFRVRVERTGDALHAVAEAAGRAAGAALARACRVPSEASPGAAARALARRAAAAWLGAPLDELEIVSCERVPRLLLRGAPCGLALSLSHHGRFAACALARREAGAP
jgi:phosphopantetheinyl transferase (holo-ACP synthase)